MKTIFTLFFTSTLALYSLGQTTIKCDDVELASHNLKEVPYQEALETALNSKFEACEPGLRETKLVQSDLHPFVQAVHFAYADHRSLTISPDMVWLLICQGFSKHIDYHGEELRDKFVDFKGKKKISIPTELFGDFRKGSPDNNWKAVFPAFADSIAKHSTPEIRDLFVQEFSTTGIMESTAFRVTLMDGMSSYFLYEMTTSCGIPEIVLEGTTEDWVKIRDEFQKMKGYKIDHWVKSLSPVLDEFVKASEGNINHDFWSEIYKRSGGSGGPYISGWVIKFFPYLKTTGGQPIKNDWLDKKAEGPFSGLTTDDFMGGMSAADFVWNYLGIEFKMQFTAGFVGIEQDRDTKMLKPAIGWAVRKEPKKK
jgi:hypothetical protein